MIGAKEEQRTCDAGLKHQCYLSSKMANDQLRCECNTRLVLNGINNLLMSLVPQPCWRDDFADLGKSDSRMQLHCICMVVHKSEAKGTLGRNEHASTHIDSWNISHCFHEVLLWSANGKMEFRPADIWAMLRTRCKAWLMKMLKERKTFDEYLLTIDLGQGLFVARDA